MLREKERVTFVYPVFLYPGIYIFVYLGGILLHQHLPATSLDCPFFF